MTDQPIRIAMWSGPRNISTAMMRSFGARGDCALWDEPFYAPYLIATGLPHPMRAEILAGCEGDAAAVSRACMGEAPGGKPIFYQKHMTHHMLPGTPMDWTEHTRQAFLIRAPERVLASYAKKHESGASLEAIGFVRQAEIFERAAERLGSAPPVADADDILRAPREALQALCAALGIGFTEKMLAWPPGPKPEDGPWAPHWYDAVNRSSGLTPTAPEPLPALPPDLARIADQARPYYDRMRAHALRV